MTYELLPHTADLRVRLRAPDLPALYQACLALVRDTLVGDSLVEPRETRALALPPVSDEGERLFRFVRELLYLFDAEAFVPARLDCASTLVVSGEAFDGTRHAPGHQVKAITRHMYGFRHTGEGYEVEMVMDL